MNKLSIFLTLLSPAACFATGLSFQTFAPTAGDILLSDNTTTLSENSLFRVGTFTESFATLDTFTSIGEFEAVFNEITTSAFTAAGEVSASIAAGNVSSGLDLYGIAYEGLFSGVSQSAVFLIGTTPTLGVLASNPSISTVLYGNKVGNNITLASIAVPEPSAFAALAGIAVLGFVGTRRRRS